MTHASALGMTWPEDATPAAAAAAAAAAAERAPSATARLTLAIRAGDAGAFATLYEAWFDRALALARSLTRRDESFCLDVVQDAMMRVVRALPRLEDEPALE